MEAWAERAYIVRRSVKKWPSREVCPGYTGKYVGRGVWIIHLLFAKVICTGTVACAAVGAKFVGGLLIAVFVSFKKSSAHIFQRNTFQGTILS